MAKLLITGITGFIGKAVLRGILQSGTLHQITALVRPGTSKERYSEFANVTKIEFIDLANTTGIRDFLAESDFDVIMHIGALRGGRKESRAEYYRSNVSSTEQMVDFCLKRHAKLIFCSSVGVFGAIPCELPANKETPKNPDNYYHYTKIECEKIIGKAIMNGLDVAIIRPSITYGQGDFGFPYQLVKMVAAYRFPLINKRIWIHLCHIDALVKAFTWLLANNYDSGLTMNVADREPVQLNALVDFISRQLRNKNYPRVLYFDRILFAFGERISRVIRNELFISRFELISKSWFYDVQTYYQLVETESPFFTIPSIQITIKDFLGRQTVVHQK